jgi:hypothetical protein
MMKSRLFSSLHSNRAQTTRRITSIVLATLCLVGLAGLVPNSASAASPGCGPACDNTDPSEPVWSAWLGASVTCGNDAVTVKQVALGEGITLQLRYSPRCRTVWGRFWGGDGDGRSYVVSLNNDIWGISFQAMTELWPGGRNWSFQMDDADTQSRTCIGHSWNWLDDIGCTSAY